MKQRTHRADGDRSREVILDTAARLATVEGLYGLSLARVAEAADMSKSGVFGLFGSKEELQLETIGRARQVFIAEVVEPALQAKPGTRRLLALCESYLDYVERRTWPGGCFFASVASEVSMRPGPVRDRVAADQREWVELLIANARLGLEAGDLPPDTDPEQLATELSTMLTGADLAFLLHGNATVLRRIRTSLRDRLGTA